MPETTSRISNGDSGHAKSLIAFGNVRINSINAHFLDQE